MSRNGRYERMDYSLRDVAAVVCRAGLQALSRDRWMRPEESWRLVRDELAQVGVVDSGTYASALDTLVQAGLVRARYEEWETSPVRPQGYRWARLATPEALERYAGQPAKRARRSA